MENKMCATKPELKSLVMGDECRDAWLNFQETFDTPDLFFNFLGIPGGWERNVNWCTGGAFVVDEYLVSEEVAHRIKLLAGPHSKTIIKAWYARQT